MGKRRRRSLAVVPRELETPIGVSVTVFQEEHR
jgi:hypothetical protein